MNIGRRDTEDDAYRRVRDELTHAEIELRDQRERVAELRRTLPFGTEEVDDYVFHRLDPSSNRPTEVRLSALFEAPDKPLVFYQFMYGGAQKEPCPMCTLWAEGLNGVAHYIRERANFAVVARASVEDLADWAQTRGWNDILLLSSGRSPMKRDFGFENAAGEQMPGVSVFVMTADGPRHFYSASAVVDENEFRGIDLLSPVWHVFDLLPQGRGDWMPSLE